MFLSRLVYALYTLFFAPTTIPRVWLPRYPPNPANIYLYLQPFFRRRYKGRSDERVARVCNAVTRPCYRLGYSPTPETCNFSIFLTNVDYVFPPPPPLFLFRDEHEFIMQTAFKLFYKHLVSFRKKLYQTTLSFLRFKMNFESQRSGFDRESLRQFNNFNFKIRAKERGDIRSKKNKRVNLLKSFRKFNLLTRTPESKKINVFIRGNCGRKNVSIVLIKVV